MLQVCVFREEGRASEGGTQEGAHWDGSPKRVCLPSAGGWRHPLATNRAGKRLGLQLGPEKRKWVKGCKPANEAVPVSHCLLPCMG
jgi:hypothetical protein